MKFKYFTSLPIDSDALKVAYEMIFKGFPMLFKDNKKGMIDLFTPNPETSLQWIFDECDDWAQIAFTSYYNDLIETQVEELQLKE